MPAYADSLFGIIFALLVIAFVVVLALGYGIHLYSITELTGGTFGSRLETYRDIDLGLSVRYPSDFTVNPEYTYSYLGQDNQIRGVAFIVSKAKTEGTNLSPDTYISVEIIPNQPSCSASLFLPDAKVTQGLVERGVSYTYAKREEGAAGNRYEEHAYALTKASPCVALRYFIHTFAIGNHELGTVEEFDRKSLISVFDTIRRSLSVRQ